MDTSQKYLNNTFPEFSQENSTHQLTSLEASLQTDFEESKSLNFRVQKVLFREA